MKKLIEKYREIIVYLIVGVLTTVFCWVVAYIVQFWLDPKDTFQNIVINTLSWVGGVLFSFPLNRKWVFKSKNPNYIGEFIGFSGSRLSTWALDILIMWLFVNVCPPKGLIKWLVSLIGKEMTPDNEATYIYWFAKICISAVLVTIANYIFSKVFIFKKKDEAAETEQKEDK